MSKIATTRTLKGSSREGFRPICLPDNRIRSRSLEHERQPQLLFVINPKWSYLLNADFEDHAEHEYMLLVAEHPEWEDIPFRSDFAAYYGSFGSLADLFRQIGHDERVHKEESIALLAKVRFS